jgi:hypothetical protein
MRPYYALHAIIVIATLFGANAAQTNYGAVENAQALEALPLYQFIPAAKPWELTPANGFPKRETFSTWERSLQ